MGLDEALRAVRTAAAAARYARAMSWETEASRWQRFDEALDALVAAARADRPLSHEAVAAMEAG